MRHRGPDDEGWYATATASASATGGSRSSTSPPAGTSRWRTRTARSGITYNGELYNYRELRRRARSARGHRFRSRTDTEVVAPRLRGVGRRLPASASTACSRSRSGTREQRAASSPATASASSRSTTRARRPLRLRLRDQGDARGRRAARASTPQALVEYFTFQNIFSDRTLFAGVHAAARRACADRRPTPTASSVRRYWDFEFDPDGSRSLERVGRARCATRFEAAVDRQLVERRAGRQLSLRRHGLGLDRRASPRSASRA